MSKTSTMRNQHAAICVRSGKIISSAVNTFRNDPAFIVARNVQSIHAEINCLRKISRPRGTVVYLARWSAYHQVTALSHPCTDCLNFMAQAGVKTVIYTGYPDHLTTLWSDPISSVLAGTD